MSNIYKRLQMRILHPEEALRTVVTSKGHVIGTFILHSVKTQKLAISRQNHSNGFSHEHYAYYLPFYKPNYGERANVCAFFLDRPELVVNIKFVQVMFDIFFN